MSKVSAGGSDSAHGQKTDSMKPACRWIRPDEELAAMTNEGVRQKDIQRSVVSESRVETSCGTYLL